MSQGSGHAAGTVLVTSRSFSTGTLDLTARLSEHRLEVIRCGAGHDLTELREPLNDAVAWIAGTGPVTAAHLDLAPRLRILARHGVGVDSVDLSAATERGVTVTITPGANSDAVAEHAIALLFAAIRGVPAGDRRVRAGDWRVIRGAQLAESRVGIIGFGRIGRLVAARLAALGCDVLVHDPCMSDDEIRAAGYQAASTSEIASSCAAVTLHCPGGHVIVDGSWLQDGRAGQFIINTARADLIDEHAVAAALRTGHLGGYAADTLSSESVTGHDPTSPLLADDLADRVIVTPHLGAQTVRSVDLMGEMATEAVVAQLAGRTPRHVVGENR